MQIRFFRTLPLAAAVAAGLLAAPEAHATGLAGAYLAARNAEVQGDYAEAARYYVQAMVHDSGNPELMQGACVAFTSLGEIEKAITIARRMESTGADTQISHLLQITGDVADGNWTAIRERVDERRGVGPLVDGLLVAWAHLGEGAMSDAIAAFDAVAKEQGMRGFGLYHKALALASVGDFEGAEEIFSGRDSGVLRSTRRGIVAHMQILSQLERNDDAIQVLEDSFEGDLDVALQSLSDQLHAGELLPFTLVTSPRDGVAEVFYSVAGALQGEANDAYTLLYARVAEHLKPDHTDTILLAAGLLEQMGQLELAVDAYKKVPVDSTAHFAAELGRADALRRDDRVDAAIEVLEQLASDRPDMPDVHVSLGDVLRQTENYSDAVDAYDRALDVVEDIGPRHWFVFYARGIANERLDRWDAAEADFRRALDLNPEHPQVLNYLGYSLVEKQMKLAEALEMIEKAVAAQPDSGYIVDSLGWVLYRLGRYEEAVEHLERAAELMPVDPIVNDHLGDVYWAVGRELEARFQWMRALSFDPEEDEAKRIRRKLEVGLDEVLAEEGAPSLIDVANGGN